MNDLTKIAVNDMAHEFCSEYCGKEGCPAFKHLILTGEQVELLWGILEGVDIYAMDVGQYMNYAMILAKLENE